MGALSQPAGGGGVGLGPNTWTGLQTFTGGFSANAVGFSPILGRADGAQNNLIFDANGRASMRSISTSQMSWFGDNSTIRIGSNNVLTWTDNSGADLGTANIGLARNAGGVLEVNTGTAGTFADLKLRKLISDATNTAGGTTGAQTINKASGTVNFAAAATSLVVTCNQCLATSIVLAVIRTNDSTAVIKNVVPAAGSFTINLNAAATAETSVGFIVIN